MRSFIFLLVLVLWQNTLSHAQESPCYGVTAEIGTVQNLTYYFGTEPTPKSSNSTEKDKYKY